MDTNSRAYSHLKQLQKASDILAWERPIGFDEAIALTSLYGLRIVAAADAYFAELGLETHAETAWRELKKTSVGIGAAVNQALDDLGRNLSIDALLRHPDFTVLNEGDLINAVATLDRIDLQAIAQSDLTDASEALDAYRRATTDLQIGR